MDPMKVSISLQDRGSRKLSTSSSSCSRLEASCWNFARKWSAWVCKARMITGDGYFLFLFYRMSRVLWLLRGRITLPPKALGSTFRRAFRRHIGSRSTKSGNQLFKKHNWELQVTQGNTLRLSLLVFCAYNRASKEYHTWQPKKPP